jgi:hypothetical protein
MMVGEEAMDIAALRYLARGWSVSPILPGSKQPLMPWLTFQQRHPTSCASARLVSPLAGHLLWCGKDPAVTLDLLLCWTAIRCRPPLPEDEVTRTVESITRLHLLHQDEEVVGGEDVGIVNVSPSLLLGGEGHTGYNSQS